MNAIFFLFTFIFIHFIIVRFCRSCQTMKKIHKTWALIEELMVVHLMAFHVKHNKESDGCIIDSRLFCRNELTIEISSMKLMTRSFVQRIKRKDTRGTKERWKSHWMKRKCVDNQQIFHCPNEKTSAFCVQMRSTGTQYQVDCHSSFFRGKYKSWMTQRHKRRVTSSHQKATIQLWKWRQKWWWNAIKCSNRKKKKRMSNQKEIEQNGKNWLGGSGIEAKTTPKW